MFTNIIISLLLQNAGLIYTDVFEATKKGLALPCVQLIMHVLIM